MESRQQHRPSYNDSLKRFDLIVTRDSCTGGATVLVTKKGYTQKKGSSHGTAAHIDVSLAYKSKTLKHRDCSAAPARWMRCFTFEV